MERGIDQVGATCMVNEVADELRAKHGKRKKVFLFAGVFVFVAETVLSYGFGFGN